MKFILFIFLYMFNLSGVNALDVDLIKESFVKGKEVNLYLDENTDDLIIDSEIFDIIKNKERVLIVNIVNNNITYSYIFNGKEFNDSYNDINLKILFGNKSKIINKNIKDNKLILFENVYKGYFPNGTILKINTPVNNKNTKLYELIKNDIFLINDKLKYSDNYYFINLKKGSNYIITNKNTNIYNNFLMLIAVSFIIILEFVSIFLILKKRNSIVK